ncbi:NucA/NucB deoxyribonuclease domain-containing protein [Azospirillum rugosum]|uniref:Deoxyribonuclease NucA/NucB domain-containing protein n=1 Tax=Azospirillum rugosum TaxID=416170 RepID=A0ABS4SN64_9PROT|nr:NucA/NucB deoxyribonuclease domain-containing protein [Azospirillum rugosum]MBP2294002.1 hypothetical protein [Azospirillum rugosum]MDQ0526811.1 hypothetical protein [Azospirillum rugosum]
MVRGIIIAFLCLLPGMAIAQPVINFDGNVFPCISYNIWSAQQAGRPALLNRTTTQATITANRTAACGPAAANVTALNGANAAGAISWSCDEYPFASSTQGGNAPVNNVLSGVMIVPAFENSTQGGALSAFYTANAINNGTQFRVTTSNVPAVLYNGPAPAPNPLPTGGLTIINLGNGVYQCRY